MNANQGVDLDTLIRGLSNAKLIPYGGGAPNGKFGGFLNALGYMKDFVSGVGATPEGMPGIIGGLGAMADRHNVRSYNKAMSQQLAMQKALELQRFEGTRQDKIGLGQQAGLNGYQGYADLPDAATLANLQNMNFQNDPNGMAALLNDGRVNAVPGANIPQYIVEGAMKQAGEVNKSNITMDKLPQFLSMLSDSGIKLTPDGMPTDAKTGMLDMSDSTAFQKALQAGASRSQMVMPGEAFQHAPVDYKAGLDFRTDEQTNQRGNKQLDETARHNKAAEKAQMIQAMADQLRAQKYQPGGGGGNPYTVPNAMQTNLNNQIKAINDQLQSGGFVDKDGKPTSALTKYSNVSQMFDGKEHNPTKYAAAQQAQQLIQMRDELQSAMYGGGPAKRIDNLNQAGQSASNSGFAAWKNGRQP